MITKTEALAALRPGEEWAWAGEDYADLQWLDSTTKPSELEIATKYAELVVAEPLNNLRSRRNQLLADSDWTQTADAPVDKAAWASYRQALRDLPATTSDPSNPAWPVKPGV